MMIRHEFKTLPPKMYLMQIMNELSKFYIFLWENQNSQNKLLMSWPEVLKMYNKNNFRTNLRKLNSLGLLNFDEDKDTISIELVSFDEIN